MRRALMFRKLAIIDVSGNAIGTALAILLAHLGYGYWALVWKPAITAFVTAARYGQPAAGGRGVRRSRRREGNRSLRAQRDGLHHRRHHLEVDGSCRAGTRYGPRELGFYQNALNVYDNAVNVSASSLHNVATATLSKLREDWDALRRAWSTALSSLAILCCPGFCRACSSWSGSSGASIGRPSGGLRAPS